MAAIREIILLACGECKRRNYTATKNRRNQTGRVEYKKYCSSCKQHTAHKEVR